jgi:lysozyme family protein
MGDASQQFVVDAHGAVLNNDERAWQTYQAQREQALLVRKLQKQVLQLAKRVQQLEERLK